MYIGRREYVLSKGMAGLVDRRATLIATDATVAFVAVLLAIWARFGASTSSVWSELGLPSVTLLAFSFAALTFASFAAAGVYRSEVYWDLRSELRDLAKGIVLLGFSCLAFLYLFKLEDVSRVAIVVSFFFLSAGCISARVLLRSGSKRRATRGEILRRWLVVGSGESVRRLVSLLEDHAHVGAGIVGLVADSAPVDAERRWLGTIYDLPEILRDNVVDEVIVSEEYDRKNLEAVLSVCAAQGKTVRLVMDSVAPTALKGRMEEYDGIAMWSVLATPEYRMELALKRVIDVVGAGVALILLSPLLLAAYLLILLVDGRPVMYRQERGGLHGREFTMLKFRTMVNGAHETRADLIDNNERSGPVFKIANDPRITRLGRVLRKTSIDEAPQLFNVLLGQMSLVGPRPQPLEEVAEYDLWHRRRLSMRPGITGLWQIRARHDPSFDTWMDNDLEYIDRWSLWLDLGVLVKTPGALIRTPGI